MKRILFVVFAISASLHIIAQTESDSIIFKSNDQGYFKTTSGTNYYVIPVGGKKAHDIYNDVLLRVARIFKSPENVTEKMVEDRAVVVNAQVNELVEAYGGVREWFDFFYRFEFNFKDGKIRVNAPDIIGGRIRMGARTLQHASFYPDNFVVTQLIKDDKSKVPVLEKYLNDILTYIVYGNAEDENW